MERLRPVWEGSISGTGSSGSRASSDGGGDSPPDSWPQPGDITNFDGWHPNPNFKGWSWNDLAFIMVVLSPLIAFLGLQGAFAAAMSAIRAAWKALVAALGALWAGWGSLWAGLVQGGWKWMDKLTRLYDAFERALNRLYSLGLALDALFLKLMQAAWNSIDKLERLYNELEKLWDKVARCWPWLLPRMKAAMDMLRRATDYLWTMLNLAAAWYQTKLRPWLVEYRYALGVFWGIKERIKQKYREILEGLGMLMDDLIEWLRRLLKGLFGLRCN
jgi:hypothetical protein